MPLGGGRFQNSSVLEQNLQVTIFFSFWGKLFAGTVPANKILFAGTVPANKKLFAGTVPANKKLFDGTVPANKKLFAGTVPANKNYFKGLSCQILFCVITSYSYYTLPYPSF